MSRIGTLLLVVALVGGAFFLGTRMRGPAPAAAPAAPVMTPEQAAAAERKSSEQPSAQPPRTFLGPDGRAHLISYDSANPPDSNDPEQVRAGLLEDMRNHPRNIQRSYGMPLADIEAIVAGKRPVPEAWLPPARDAAQAPEAAR
jgi:predicted lipid-binding transport protein (Tim44 family)